MAFVPASNVAEFVIKAVLAGQEIVNVLHFHSGSAWTASSLLSAVNTLMSTWIANPVTNQSADLVYDRIIAKDLTTNMGVTVEVPFPAGTTGGVGSASEPGNVAAEVGEKTALAGRSARGRIYLGGIPKEYTVDGVLITGAQTAYLANLNTVLSTMAAAGLAWGVLSRFSGYTQSPPKYKKIPTPRAAGIFTPITSFVMDRFTDSQRRRLPGRGI